MKPRLNISNRLGTFSQESLSLEDIEGFYSLSAIPASCMSNEQPYVWSNAVLSLDGVSSLRGRGKTISSNEAEWNDDDRTSSKTIAMSHISADSGVDWRLLTAGWAYSDCVIGSGEILRNEQDVQWIPTDTDILEYRTRVLKKVGKYPISAIVTQTGNIPLDHPMLRNSSIRTIIFTTPKGFARLQAQADTLDVFTSKRCVTPGATSNDNLGGQSIEEFLCMPLASSPSSFSVGGGGGGGGAETSEEKHPLESPKPALACDCGKVWRFPEENGKGDSPRICALYLSAMNCAILSIPAIDSPAAAYSSIPSFGPSTCYAAASSDPSSSSSSSPSKFVHIENSTSDSITGKEAPRSFQGLFGAVRMGGVDLLQMLRVLKAAFHVNYADVSAGATLLGLFVSHRLLDEYRCTKSGAIFGHISSCGLYSRTPSLHFETGFSTTNHPIVIYEALRVGFHSCHLFLRCTVHYQTDGSFYKQVV